jgi:hypothetical protein
VSELGVVWQSRFLTKTLTPLPFPKGAVSLFLYVFIAFAQRNQRIILSPRIPPRTPLPLIVRVFPMIFFQKYGLNGDKVGLFVLNGFLHSALNVIPLFVIPTKAGTQTRGVGFLPPISAEVVSFFGVRTSSGWGCSRTPENAEQSTRCCVKNTFDTAP